MVQIFVAYIIFNRTQHTEKAFAVLREQRPSELFIIADGPRSGCPTDVARCAAVREIVERVDWRCNVRRNYVYDNIRLKQRVSSGFSSMSNVRLSLRMTASHIWISLLFVTT